jgi:RNA polymerase sigma-70 factor (ECF subfamily)
MPAAFACSHPLDFLAFMEREEPESRAGPSDSGEPSGRMSPASAQSPTPPDVKAQNEADAALVRQVAAADREALARLYDRFSRPLYSLALRILRDTAEAEDVVHDVFVSIWKNAANFDPARCSALGWAIALTRNRTIDRLRTRQRRTQLLDTTPPSDLGYDESHAAESFVGDLWLKEKAAVVRRAVTELSADQRRALELAFFGGLTQQEIAAQLKEPLGTVKARIRRGLLKLREILADRL